jgi:hypothetical protein
MSSDLVREVEPSLMLFALEENSQLLLVLPVIYQQIIDDKTATISEPQEEIARVSDVRSVKQGSLRVHHDNDERA